MKYTRITIILALLCCFACASSQDMMVHDPVMIKQSEKYYLFCTGFGISCWSSTDRVNWKKENPVFSKAPEWAGSGTQCRLRIRG